MKLRRHKTSNVRTDAPTSEGDGGGHGAEYVESAWPREDDDEAKQADRMAWRRARHWVPSPD